MAAATLLVSGTLFLIVAYAYCNPLKIGAIFDINSEHKERAFHVAVDQFNNRNNNYSLKAAVWHVPPDDPFATMEAACFLIAEGVVGILGPSSQHNALMAQSICDYQDIPYLDVRWVNEPGSPTINFYPHQEELSRMYIDVIKAWEFKNFIVLYDDDESLKRMATFLNLYEGKNHRIVMRQLDKTHRGEYRPVLKEVWKSGATHIILDCSLDILEEVLHQAQQVGLISNKHYYLITNLDLHTLDLMDYQYSETTIIGIRAYDPENEFIKELSFKIFEKEIENFSLFNWNAAWKLQLEAVLVVDAITIFGEVLLQELPNIPLIETKNCWSKNPSSMGSTITNLLKGKQYNGLSGLIEFDVKGYRTNFEIDLFEVMEGGITKVGNWSKLKKLSISRPVRVPEDHHIQTLTNQHFRVLISLVPPFASYTKTHRQLSGNSRYEGFAVDLIDELSKIEGFNYTFINQIDKKNGDKNKLTGKWEGMIGEIVEGRADLAIADLTITSDRQMAVDFTTPFMNLGISILYQKPRKAPPSFFSFADPFAVEIWILVFVSFFTVSIVLFILGRISSSEWSNPYPCIEEPEFLVNQLSLRNCFWFVSGSIMQQGSEIGPVAVSTRMVAGMWWFFTLIMVSSYTANLAAFLTTETPEPHFTNVRELLENSEKRGIKWGAKKGGSTVTFFEEAQHQIDYYGKIHKFMIDNQDDVLYDDPTKGVERAERENYAFFMEITSIEYEVQRRCNLTSVGGLLDEKSYGIAIKKNSTYRNVLSRAISDLQHSGKLNELKRKWWEEKRGGGFCGGDDDGSEATALNLKNVGGVFWMTIGGVAFALLLVIMEMVLHVAKESIKSKTSPMKTLTEEFKFYFRFSGMVKPVIYNTDSGEISRKSSQQE